MEWVAHIVNDTHTKTQGVGVVKGIKCKLLPLPFINGQWWKFHFPLFYLS